eukprot:2122661-Rhodomonas_salina.3
MVSLQYETCVRHAGCRHENSTPWHAACSATHRQSLHEFLVDFVDDVPNQNPSTCVSFSQAELTGVPTAGSAPPDSRNSWAELTHLCRTVRTDCRNYVKALKVGRECNSHACDQLSCGIVPAFGRGSRHALCLTQSIKTRLFTGQAPWKSAPKSPAWGRRRKTHYFSSVPGFGPGVRRWWDTSAANNKHVRSV